MNQIVSNDKEIIISHVWHILTSCTNLALLCREQNDKKKVVEGENPSAIGCGPKKGKSSRNTIFNHNYNKIFKSDWLSTSLISALIGQFDTRVLVGNWTPRVTTRALQLLFSLLAKRNWNFFCFDLKKEPHISQILLKLWLIGNRTSCRTIRSGIIVVITQIGLPRILLITRIIIDRIGLHSVLLLLLRIVVRLCSMEPPGQSLQCSSNFQLLNVDQVGAIRTKYSFSLKLLLWVLKFR